MICQAVSRSSVLRGEEIEPDRMEWARNETCTTQGTCKGEEHIRGFLGRHVAVFLRIGNGHVYSYIPLDAWSVNVAAEVIAKVTSELYTEVNAEVSKAVSAEVTTELR